MTRRTPAILPYGDIVAPLLDAIFDALGTLVANSNASESDINLHFRFLQEKRPQRGPDPHLFLADGDNSLRSQRDDPVIHATRISRLVRQAFISAEQGNNRTRTLLPSPLAILFDFLTVPDEPASRAYVLLTLRNFLFREFSVRPHGQNFPDAFSDLTYQDIVSALSTAETYSARRDNFGPTQDPAQQLVRHYLALKGCILLRFGVVSDQGAENHAVRTKYCAARKLHGVGYEFTRHPDLESFPDAAAVINELWGVPLPVRGADTVFFGGLKFPAKNKGLVVSVSGKAGTGKTSFALALSAALAPQATQTYYVTAEEEPSDLAWRLTSLTPQYMRDLTIFPGRSAGSPDWFKAVKVPPSAPSSSDGRALHGLLAEMKSMLAKSLRVTPPSEDVLPSICPLLVILDGLQFYLEKDNEPSDLEELINQCRDLGVLVVLLTSTDIEARTRIDYLVDAVIKLEYCDTGDPKKKPVRILNLLKTRHQVSRPGSHVFHLSGQHGFRISPQVPSELDRRSQHKARLPDKYKIIDTLNRPAIHESIKIDFSKSPKQVALKVKRKAFLNLYVGSRILVHGVGSSGKAGFGLKLLLAPYLNGEQEEIRNASEQRVLVVSFLYPEEYYNTLTDNLSSLITKEYPGSQGVPTSNVSILHFRPGFLGPEDMFSKIARRLDEGDLLGRPFTGILLDGVHNVFLQFPKLEESDMLWPMLFAHLRTRPVTVVTTHTTFSMPGIPGDESILQSRRAQPFLHALVQAADFFLDVSGEKPNSATSAEFRVDVNSAFDQKRPLTPLPWDRERLVVFTEARQRELLLKVPEKPKSAG